MLVKFLSDNTVFVVAMMLVILFMALFIGLFKYKLIMRITNVADLPKDFRGEWISGIVTSVMDGDGFKFYHVPWLRSPEYTKEDPKLVVRLAGIDAPESASWGIPGQPFSKEAKEYLSQLVLGKMVNLKIIKIDRYGRLLAICLVNKFVIFTVNVNLEMVKVGLACVYIGSGAEYDEMLDDFNAAEKKARNGRLGMWTQDDYMSPMEYKKKRRRQ